MLVLRAAQAAWPVGGVWRSIETTLGSLSSIPEGSDEIRRRLPVVTLDRSWKCLARGDGEFRTGQTAGAILAHLEWSFIPVRLTLGGTTEQLWGRDERDERFSRVVGGRRRGHTSLGATPVSKTLVEASASRLVREGETGTGLNDTCARETRKNAREGIESASVISSSSPSPSPPPHLVSVRGSLHSYTTPNSPHSGTPLPLRLFPPSRFPPRSLIIMANDPSREAKNEDSATAILRPKKR